MTKAKTSRWIMECAYCGRLVEDWDDHFDLAPSGPVVYRPAPAGLPVLKVVCEGCHEERLLLILGDYGRPAGEPRPQPMRAAI